MRAYLVTGLVYMMCMCVAMAALTGCKHKKMHPNFVDTSANGPASNDGLNSGNGGSQRLNDSALQGEYGAHPELNANKIYFAYNSASLAGPAMTALGKCAEIMKRSPNMYRIEGHCDERGTQEYNLTLGEKRAQAVRDYLIKLGIPGDSLLTMSYGKEKPERDGHTEADWKYNRRCEFSVRVR